MNPKSPMPTKTKPVTNVHNGKRFTLNQGVRILPGSSLALMSSKPADCVWVVVDPFEIYGDRDADDINQCYILPTRKNGTLRVANEKNRIVLPNATFEALVKNGTFTLV